MAKNKDKQKIKPTKALTGIDFLKDEIETISISPAFDAATGGLQEGSSVVITGYEKVGKCQPRSSIVYTPTGPTTIGALKIGDEVCTPNGKKTKVVGIYPQGDQDVYEITFVNGDKVRSSLEHLWKVSDGEKEKVMKLRDLIDNVARWRYIPCITLAHFKETKGLTPAEYGKEVAEKIKLDQATTIDLDYIYTHNLNRVVLFNHIWDHSGQKMYRDSFPCIDLSGKKHKEIIPSLKDLVQSLGGIVRSRDDVYYFILPKNSGLVGESNFDQLYRKISSIKKVGREETVCIKVADKYEMYITDHFIQTHNTTLCLSIAATAQQPTEKYPDGRLIFFYDVEGRLRAERAQEIKGLSFAEDKFRLIRTEDGANLMSAEDYLNTLVHNMKMYPGAIHIVDSFSTMVSRNRLDADIGTSEMCGTPRMLWHYTDKVSQLLRPTNSIVLGIYKLIANPAPNAGPSVRGGKAPLFECQYNWRAITKKILTDGDDNAYGQMVTWRTFASPTKPPVDRFESYLRYGVGIDKEMEIISFAKDMALIEVKGAWYNLTKDGKEYKYQGMDNFRTGLVENPELYEYLEAQVKECL